MDVLHATPCNQKQYQVPQPYLWDLRSPWLFNHLYTNLGGGFKHFSFSPLPGEDEPILTSIFFKGVGEKPPASNGMILQVPQALIQFDPPEPPLRIMDDMDFHQATEKVRGDSNGRFHRGTTSVSNRGVSERPKMAEVFYGVK